MSRACEICGDGYGGTVVPAIMMCCLKDVCFDCAENHRNAKIAELTGNRKKIKCMFCNAPFHCSKGEPWKLNTPLLDRSGIKVDSTAVREAQATMQEAPAPKRRRRNNQEMSQQAETQDMDTEEGGGEGADSPREDRPPSASRWVRRSSRAISRAGPTLSPITPSPQQETAVAVGGQRRPEDVQVNLHAGSSVQRNDTGLSDEFTRQAFSSTVNSI